MSALSIQPTYPIFTDIDGQPLEDGYVWIGTANLDPQTNPINVYWDAALTLPAAQPIRTLAGYPANSGTPARLYVNSDYSIRVMNKNGSTVYSAPAATERYGNIITLASLDFLQSGAGAIARNAQSKMREWVSVDDFATPADALSNANQIDTITVPLNGTTTPAASPGKNILWEYVDGGDSDNVLTAAGARGGFFADYDCKANKVLIAQITESQAGTAGGGYRDLIFFDAVDNDTTDYTSIGQKVTHAIRAYAQGAHNGASYQAQYKDIVGANIAALGNIQWAARGVSGLAVDAYQFGLGIASNEFAVHNPSAANGSTHQSTSMAAVQAIVRSRFADEDLTHTARGIYIENNGLRITSGIEIISNTAEGFNSHFKFGLNMGPAAVTQSAIYMPFSAGGSGNAGTIIEYDPNDFSYFDRANNWFSWSVGGANSLFVGQTGIGIGAQPVAKTKAFFGASTSTQSHLQLYPGATPSSPNNGELWFDGTNVKIVVGGVTKTFTLV